MGKKPESGQIVAKEVEPVEPVEVTALMRTEIDMQVATAKRFPRSIETFLETAMSMATVDEDTAASCYYVLPRAKKDIVGPSIRLAEILVSCWGNLRSETRVGEAAEKNVMADATVWDVQTNILHRSIIKRRITTNKGDRYNDDMIGMTGSAAAAIAFRNAAFKVIPGAYVNQIYERCRVVAAGDIKSLAQNRTEAFGYFKRFGVTDERILAILGKTGIADVDLKDVGKLRGIATAIKEKSTTIDEAFPEPKKSERSHFGFGKKDFPQPADNGAGAADPPSEHPPRSPEEKPTVSPNPAGAAQPSERDMLLAAYLDLCESKDVTPAVGHKSWTETRLKEEIDSVASYDPDAPQQDAFA
jgi:hypothetical protein